MTSFLEKWPFRGVTSIALVWTSTYTRRNQDLVARTETTDLADGQTDWVGVGTGPLTTTAPTENLTRWAYT